MSVECGSCGKRLSEVFAAEPRRPCPDCGAMSRAFSESLVTVAQASVSAFESLHYGHTGREVQGAEAERRAIDWAASPNRDTIVTHQVADDFRDLLASAPCISADGLVLFRGSGIQEYEQRPPSVERMGPLPQNQTPREGRYHREDQRALYLADSEDGVRREMEAWHTEGTPYIIKVEVPITSLRIADFSDWPTDHLITAVFSRAEMCNVAERGPTNYIFSQEVGQLVAETFDGMRIPGVRGAPDGHYRNVVLFRQLEDWPTWTNSESPAYRLFFPPHEHIAVAAYYLWEKDGRFHGRDQIHWFKAIDDLP
jgi:Protein of unknown function (DUF2934)/RES domain